MAGLLSAMQGFCVIGIVMGNFPPRWLEPGDALIRPDVTEAHRTNNGERTTTSHGST